MVLAVIILSECNLLFFLLSFGWRVSNFGTSLLILSRSLSFPSNVCFSVFLRHQTGLHKTLDSIKMETGVKRIQKTLKDTILAIYCIYEFITQCHLMNIIQEEAAVLQ